MHPVPDDETLAAAYRLAVRKQKLQDAIDQAQEAIDAEPEAEVPETLAEQVRAKIAGTAVAWDAAAWGIARQATANTDGDASHDPDMCS
jgi:hypothetical protein